AVAKLYQAGAILIGKLATHEFSHGGPSFDLPWPPARNPWQPEHYSGGSSSGSGTAVAAGFVPLALGSDTGGSICMPALLCGVVGLKPTYGLVSRRGVMQNSATFDSCGPMTWTVEDCAIALQALAGHDPYDPTSVRYKPPEYRTALTGDIRGVRIGVRHFWEEDQLANAELCAAMEASIEVLRSLGARIEDARMHGPQDYHDIKLVIAESEIFSVYQQELITRASDFGADFLWKTLPACLFQATEYIQAQRELRRMVAAMQPLYERYDVLVTGGAGPASRLDAYRPIAFWEKPINIATPFSITGGPAIALCNGFSNLGLPLGMQIAGRPFEEAMVFRVAHAYEQATAWRKRRPQLVAGAPRIPVEPASEFDGVVETDQRKRELVDRLARRTGLNLTDVQLARLHAASPYALEIAGRIHRDHTWWDGPANVFQPSGSHLESES
ncbi:MAG: amidase, partial [Pseudomonadota bacterium]